MYTTAFRMRNSRVVTKYGALFTNIGLFSELTYVAIVEYRPLFTMYRTVLRFAMHTRLERRGAGVETHFQEI